MHSEAAREFRERLELIKVEQERLALKEQQFVKQVHKVESEARREAQVARDKVEAERAERVREVERVVEEYEERLARARDEAEEMRRRMDRAERAEEETRRTKEEAAKRDEKRGEQYERILEGLRADVREKDRELANMELRENFKKEELAREVRELQDKLKKLTEDVKLS
jgi:colicin import membrane protein